MPLFCGASQRLSPIQRREERGPVAHVPSSPGGSEAARCVDGARWSPVKMASLLRRALALCFRSRPLLPQALSGCARRLRGGLPFVNRGTHVVAEEEVNSGRQDRSLRVYPVHAPKALGHQIARLLPRLRRFPSVKNGLGLRERHLLLAVVADEADAGWPASLVVHVRVEVPFVTMLAHVPSSPAHHDGNQIGTATASAIMASRTTTAWDISHQRSVCFTSPPPPAASRRLFPTTTERSCATSSLCGVLARRRIHIRAVC